jgi:hypothetical protein
MIISVNILNDYCTLSGGDVFYLFSTGINFDDEAPPLPE